MKYVIVEKDKDTNITYANSFEDLIRWLVEEANEIALESLREGFSWVASDYFNDCKILCSLEEPNNSEFGLYLASRGWSWYAEPTYKLFDNDGLMGEHLTLYDVKAKLIRRSTTYLCDNLDDEADDYVDLAKDYACDIITLAQCDSVDDFGIKNYIRDWGYRIEKEED